jgi:hypothetical protein
MKTKREKHKIKKKPSNFEAGHPFLFWKPIMRREVGREEGKSKQQWDVKSGRSTTYQVLSNLTKLDSRGEEERQGLVVLAESPVSRFLKPPNTHSWELGEDCKKQGPRRVSLSLDPCRAANNLQHQVSGQMKKKFEDRKKEQMRKAKFKASAGRI